MLKSETLSSARQLVRTARYQVSNMLSMLKIGKAFSNDVAIDQFATIVNNLSDAILLYESVIADMAPELAMGNEEKSQ